MHHDYATLPTATACASSLRAVAEDLGQQFLAGVAGKMLVSITAYHYLCLSRDRIFRALPYSAVRAPQPAAWPLRWPAA